MAGTPKNEQRPYGGFILTFEPGRCERIDAALRYRRHEATETFSSADWKFERRELVLISLSLAEAFGGDRTLDGVALMERTKTGGATGKLKMRLYDPVMLDDPLEMSDLAATLRRSAPLSTSLHLRRIEPRAWRKLLDRVKSLRPASALLIDQLEQRQFQDHRIVPVNERTLRLMEQRDALGVSLEVAGLDRREILSSLETQDIEHAKSVLDLLDSEPLQEQDAIRADQQAFGALLTRGMRHARFSDDSGAEVRVHVYDKKPLETLLGIDLLIYLQLYDAYILIQYKMMQKSKRAQERWYYTADAQLQKQLATMKRVVSSVTPPTSSPLPIRDWRLNEEAFFWKFCESTRDSDTEGALVHGITLCRTHLESFLALPASAGPNGGRRVGYGNCQRYLTTTQFVDLAQAGWIGGGPGMRRVMEDILTANQQGGRQTLLTTVSQARQLDELRRGWK